MCCQKVHYEDRKESQITPEAYIWTLNHHNVLVWEMIQKCYLITSRTMGLASNTVRMETQKCVSQFSKRLTHASCNWGNIRLGFCLVSGCVHYLVSPLPFTSKSTSRSWTLASGTLDLIGKSPQNIRALHIGIMKPNKPSPHPFAVC